MANVSKKSPNFMNDTESSSRRNGSIIQTDTARPTGIPTPPASPRSAEPTSTQDNDGAEPSLRKSASVKSNAGEGPSNLSSRDKGKRTASVGSKIWSSASVQANRNRIEIQALEAALRETRDSNRETRNSNRETRNSNRETRDPNRETRNPNQEMREINRKITNAVNGMLNPILAQVDERMKQQLEPIHQLIAGLTTQIEQSTQRLAQVDERTQQYLEPIHEAITELTTQTEQSTQRLAQVDERMQQYLEPIREAITELTTQTEQSTQRLAQVDERTQQHLEPIHEAITELTTQTEQSAQQLAQVDEHMQRHLQPIDQAIMDLTTKIEQLSQKQTRFQRLDDAAMILVWFRNKDAKARLNRDRQTVTAQGAKSRGVTRNSGG